jgi:phosphatidylinositol-3-phosphatase
MPSKARTIKFHMFPHPWAKRKSFAFITGFVSLVFSLAGCGGGAAANVAPPTPTPGQTNPQFGHVFIVVEENASYADVIGSSSMPYFNSLANTYGLATNYYANLHPSIPNYFELTVGKTLTIDDSQTPQSFPVSDDNVVRELLAAGKTWKSYAEDLPSAGYTGGNTAKYLVRHNPLAYMTDVQNTPAQAQNLVPFSEFAADLPTANLPQYSFIVPNSCDDAHDCPLSTADAWLKTNIDPLINSSVFQKDGLLIIVFDEGNSLDFTQRGGHVAAVIISPFGKPAYKSIALYQHQSVLRLMLEGLGVTKLPGDAATAPAMWEFFK